MRLADPGVTRMFDERLYKRGGLTLHALRRHIGDVPFFALMRAWSDEHRHGLVTTDAFTAAAERSRGKAAGRLLPAMAARHGASPDPPLNCSPAAPTPADTRDV